MYLGMVALDSELSAVLMVRNSSSVPVQADSAPSIRVYGESGDAIGLATLSSKDSGSVTGATNASPIVITSSDHGLQNGQRVTITGVGGNTAANTTATVANKTDNTFEMAGVAGNGDYTSSGTWVVTGLYSISLTPTLAGGFASGNSYSIIANYVVSSTSYVQVFTFTVL